MKRWDGFNNVRKSIFYIFPVFDEDRARPLSQNHENGGFFWKSDVLHDVLVRVITEQPNGNRLKF